MLDCAGLSNELFRFSTTALQWEQLDAALVSGVPPSARAGHIMAVVGSEIFAFGGQTSYSGGISGELFRFSTTMLQWEQLDATLVSGSPPSARFGHAMAAVGSDLFVFTGTREEARCACWPCQISRRQLLRALLLCARGLMVSNEGAVFGGTRVWW